MNDTRRAPAIRQIEEALRTGDDFPGADEVLALTRIVAALNARVQQLQENIDRLERRGGL